MSKSEIKELIMKRLSIITFLLFVGVAAGSETFAQRKAVSGAEVTGRFSFSNTNKKGIGISNDILIQALGHNKLKIEMLLVYFYEAPLGVDFRDGWMSGEAVIEGDTAVFTYVPSETASDSCKITLKFSKPGTLIVTTEPPWRCGQPSGVLADGTYKKTSGAKPKFSVN
ncbi:MAG: hypothetical protein ACREA2_10080 [Blastocatellia bacterium]